ncbi:GumC family protein [Muricoccus radiodurans]|uniref:GumC family protein n=1 Tax=Muricoccus radiodurans TaxID=2231721 RepID=UPI003CED11E4
MQLADVLLLLWRNKALLVAAALLSGAAGYVAQHAMPKQYAAEGLLLIESQTPVIPELNLAPVATVQPSQRIRTEADVLRSHRLAADVAERTSVLPEAAADEGPSLRTRIGGAIGGALNSLRELAGFGMAASGTSAPSAEDQRGRLAEDVERRLEIRTNDNSNVIGVRFTSPAPEIAARVVNTLMERYIALDLAFKGQSTEQANRWLSERLEALRQEVEVADARIQALRRETGLVETSSGPLSSLQLAEEQTRVAAARQELARAQAALDAAQGSGARGATVEALASPTIRQLRDREAETMQRLATMSQRLASQHPDRIAAEAELRDLRRQIDGEVGKLTTALRRDVDAARSRLESAQAALTGSRSAARQGVEAGVTLAQLTREADARRQVYQAFLLRTEQTSLFNAQFPAARIISPAAVPVRPKGPSAAVVGVFGAVAGAALCAALLLLWRMRRSTILSVRDLSDVTGTRVLASLPALSGGIRRGMPRMVLEQSASGIAETLRALRINLAMSTRQGASTILVTSPSVGDGKTTLSLSLAQICAADGLRVLLIEADMRRPRVAAALKLPRSRPSLESVLEGRATILDAVHVDKASGLHCLVSDRSSTHPQSLIESAAFEALMQRARSEYQIVVLDSPPIMRVADATILSKQSDVVLLAVGWDRTPMDMVSEAIQRLPENARERTYTVLTRVQPGRLEAASYYAGYAQSSPRSVPLLAAAKEPELIP